MSANLALPAPLLLASGSAARRRLLEAAGLAVEAQSPRVDEESARDSLRAEGFATEDAAIALAELKGRRLAAQHPDRLVLSGDQLLDCEGRWLEKPPSRQAAADQLRALSGRSHRLVTAAMLFAGGQRIWHHVETPRLTMRRLSDSFIEAYLDAAWPAVADSVGAYHLEALGVRLMAKIEGDAFAIQGLPLPAILKFLTERGDLPA